MKISEAARYGGVTVSTFKYYLREGLVPEGIRLSGNQTAYGDEHVQRVRLVRALLETGGLSIERAKAVVSTIDSPDNSLAITFEAAQQSLAGTGSSTTPPSNASLARVEALAAEQRWKSLGANPGVEVAARVLDGLAAIGFEPSVEYLTAYAAAASTIARADLAALTTRTRPDLVAELMVVGTVLGDSLIAGLRRLAQESVTSEFFPAAPSTEPEPTTTETDE